MFKTEDRLQAPLIALAAGLAFGALVILASMTEGVDRFPGLSPVERGAPATQNNAAGDLGQVPEFLGSSAAAGGSPSADRSADVETAVHRLTPERLVSNIHILFWLVLALVGCGVMLLALLGHTRRRARLAAVTDALTGLLNRRAFTYLIQDYNGLHVRDGKERLAILLFDIDDFKLVNDQHGHEEGDRLLTAFANRLGREIGARGVFARLGGDEFAVALFGENAGEEARSLAERLIALNGEPFTSSGEPFFISTSIGGSISNGDTSTAESLIREADIALYQAKATSQTVACFFDAQMEMVVTRKQALLRDLGCAIAKGELSLMFQPIVDLEDEKLVSFEALLRWTHPERGSISPGEFIPLAEESGQIIPIGLWVIAQACRVAATWPDHIRFSINLSPRQFSNDALVPTVLGCLGEQGIDPSRLTVEITETTIIENDRLALAALEALRAHGVKIALDDFGTGFASLSYLTRFPFDTVKIDQSFVRLAREDNNADLVIASICDLATRLGLDTVAEGIESTEHRHLVQKAGCMRGQGYLFGRPEKDSDCATRISLQALTAAQTARLAASGEHARQTA